MRFSSDSFSSCIGPLAVSILFAPVSRLQAEPKQDRLNKEQIAALVGPDALVTELLRKTLLDGPDNKEVYEDLDGDGDPDVVTYIDGAARHSDERRPMLFRVLDDDDDMTEQSGPDKDSDFYVADWNADGVIDRVVDYWDEDGDGDADRQDLISRRGLWYSDNIGLTVVRDIGDDDRMWYTRDNEYSQEASQWLTDFNGDESFCMYRYVEWDHLDDEDFAGMLQAEDGVLLENGGLNHNLAGWDMQGRGWSHRSWADSRRNVEGAGYASSGEQSTGTMSRQVTVVRRYLRWESIGWEGRRGTGKNAYQLFDGGGKLLKSIPPPDSDDWHNTEVDLSTLGLEKGSIFVFKAVDDNNGAGYGWLGFDSVRQAGRLVDHQPFAAKSGLKRGRFVPTFEDPFTHHDTDGDGLAEIVVRFSGRGAAFGKGRYSFDVDNDSHWLNRRDFDFSFNLGGADEPLKRWVTQQDPLRDGSLTMPRIPWQHAQQAMEAAPWSWSIFCWDEIDNNVAIAYEHLRDHERWEGVGGYGGSISYGYRFESNKRWEEDSDNSGKLELYYSPVDRRIHQYGAEEGVMHLDYNYDLDIDAKFIYKDTDQDGVIDSIAYDGNNDDRPERTYDVDMRAMPIEKNLDEMTPLYRKALADSLEQNQQLIEVMKRVTPAHLMPREEQWFVERRDDEFYLPEKLYWSDEAIRLYQDMIREDLYTQLLAKIDSRLVTLQRAPLEELYAQGDYHKVARWICEQLNMEMPSSEPWLEVEGTTFSKRVRLTLTNPIEQDRPSVPVVVSLSDLKKVAPDFNPKCFAVTETRRRILIRQHPSQPDDLDRDGHADEIVFSVNLIPGRAIQDFFVYYNPHGEWQGRYRQQTQAKDKASAGGLSVGWESELIGFRSYYGKMDYFGKKIECLKLDDFGDFHKENDWGTSVLHIGSAPGIGGLSLWRGDDVHRAYNEDQQLRCKLEQGISANGPVRSAVWFQLNDLRAGSDTYTVSIIASCYAGQIYSEHRIHVKQTSGKSTSWPLLSSGLVRNDPEQVHSNAAGGWLCSWGLQSRDVGALGQAVVVDPRQAVDTRTLSDSQELRLRLDERGGARVFIAGEWEKSRTNQRRLVAKTGSEWRRHVARLAERVQNPVRVKLHAPQSKQR